MRTKPSIAIALSVLIPCIGASAQERPRVPQGPPGTVTLPVGEYDRLVDRAARPPAQPDVPPVAAVIARAELRARAGADMARGTVRLDGEVFQRGHVRVPLVTGAALLDARADGRPLPLLHEGNVHAAVLAGPGAFAVTLEWAAPLTSTAGRASFALPVPAGGSLSATLDLPGDPADVRVEPGLVTRRETAAGRTTIEVTLEPGRQAHVSWSVREAIADAAPVESRTLADMKSLITIGEADLRMVALVDITVVRGEPRTFEVRLPAGFEVSAVTGSSLDTSDTRAGAIALTVRDPARRRHQFLISLEQPHAPGSFKLDTSFPTVSGAQREVGETAVEGTGTLEVTAAGDDALRRMDVREINAALRSLARQPLLAAFRYQRRPGEARVLTLDVKRFADAPVIAAAAERASATTLVTVEGRMLTEVALWIRNRAQPFMKVTLPPGATMLSVDVAGETAKPVTGADGTRVPLLRPGFRPDGPYHVSFVYLHAGQAFAKRGEAQMALPQIDVPVSVLEWELFLPDRYSAKPLAGNVIPARMIGDIAWELSAGGSRQGRGYGGGTRDRVFRPLVARPGQIVGRVTDATGAEIPGVTVTVTGPDGIPRTATSDADGVYALQNVPSGRVTVTGALEGFRAAQQSFVFDQQPRQLDFQMSLGTMSETVEVRAGTDVVEPRAPRRDEEPAQQAPSQNVLNLQRRVAGVLPVRIDVPRSGTSYRFVRPLVFEEETVVSFRYKTR